MLPRRHFGRERREAGRGVTKNIDAIEWIGNGTILVGTYINAHQSLSHPHHLEVVVLTHAGDNAGFSEDWNFLPA